MVKEDLFTSLHISEYEIEVRDTKLGEEELTPDIPNVSEEATKDLDQNGIIRIGAHVKEGDIINFLDIKILKTIAKNINIDARNDKKELYNTIVKNAHLVIT